MTSRSKLLVAAALLALVGTGVYLFVARSDRRASRVESTDLESARKTTSADIPRPSLPGEAAARPEVLRLAPAVVTMVPAKTGRFVGVVIDWASGTPVPHAELAFLGSGGVTSVVADADGGFRFEPPALGTFRLALVSADGFFPYAPNLGAGAIVLRAAPDTAISGLVFYLTPKLAYRGVVVDSRGEPVAQATVDVVSSGTAQLDLAPSEDHFVSGTDGRFVFSAPDEAVLEARHPSRGVGRAAVDHAVAVSHELTIKLVEAIDTPRSLIRGLVLDENGIALAGAAVRATSGAETIAISSDDEGRFELRLAANARARIIASSPNLASASVFVTTGSEATSTDIILELSRGGQIRGRVLSSDGASVPAFSIVVSRPAGVARITVATASFFDASGRFLVAGLEPGSYSVTAAAYGFAVSEPVAASASIDREGDRDGDRGADRDREQEIVLTLPRGGALFGRVLDAESGAPLELARVSVELSFGGGDSAQPIVSSVVTAPDGSFELAGLAPGRASVVADARDHHSRIIGGLAVESRARLGPLDIALTPTKEGETPSIELAGIGAQLSATGDGLEVQRLIDGGGALEAGIAVGDIIVAVDGQPLTVIGMDKAIGMIRGPIDTTVILQIRRGEGELLTVTAVRRRIRA